MDGKERAGSPKVPEGAVLAKSKDNMVADGAVTHQPVRLAPTLYC